jgi:antitoxin component of MazEF toxin-antitoxin module
MNKTRPGQGHFDTSVVQNARVFKAGNSLAIRIPSVIAKHCELEDGVPVQLVGSEGVIYVRKAPARDLTALIDRITPDNVHGAEFQTIAGRERW